MADKVKVRRPSAAVSAAKPQPKPKEPALDEGDQVEFSTTAYVKLPGKGEFWVKCGAATTVRHGEDPDDAVGRLHGYVLENLQEQIQELSS